MSIMRRRWSSGFRPGEPMHDRYAVDHDFLSALQTGMPPSGGIAVGVDRLIMLFADAASIHDTLWMPGRELFGPAPGAD